MTDQEILISCAEVHRELSNYIDDELTPGLRARIEEHVKACSGCKAVYDGVRNVGKKKPDLSVRLAIWQ